MSPPPEYLMRHSLCLLNLHKFCWWFDVYYIAEKYVCMKNSSTPLYTSFTLVEDVHEFS
jgi:hypothetical protein